MFDFLKRAQPSKANIATRTQLATPKQPPRGRRVSTWKEGRVDIPTVGPRSGVVLDYGRHGVRMRFQSATDLPELVYLKIPDFELYATARVVWQTQMDAGFEFVGPGPN